MMNSSTKKWLMLIVLYILALLGSVVLTFAYYQKEQAATITLQTGDADIRMVVSFDDVSIDSSSVYYDITHQEFIIDASDEEAFNALSKLNINILIDAEYASRVRIRLHETYIRTRTYVGVQESLHEALAITGHVDGYHHFSQLKKGDIPYLHQHEDGYQYVNRVVSAHEVLNIPIIDGGRMLYARVNQQFVEHMTLRLSLIVEVVQANRYQEIWQVDSTVFGS